VSNKTQKTDPVPDGVNALSPNKQLQRTVIRRRGRVARAPFHHARAPRWTRDHAAAELQRSATNCACLGVWRRGILIA
jgi:hypothetical protein